MNLNTNLAEGVLISSKDFEEIIAIRKPNADTKIKFQIVVKCKAKQIKRK